MDDWRHIVIYFANRGYSDVMGLYMAYNRAQNTDAANIASRFVSCGFSLYPCGPTFDRKLVSLIVTKVTWFK